MHLPQRRPNMMPMLQCSRTSYLRKALRLCKWSPYSILQRSPQSFKAKLSMNDKLLQPKWQL